MHIPVLLGETIELLKIKKGDVVVDATLGAGGHAVELLKTVGAEGRVIAIDVDEEAIVAVEEKLQKENPELLERVIFINDNFVNIAKVVQKLELSQEPHAIVADLGWRIEQIEGEKYGMSFQEDFPLDMRLGSKIGQITAADIVNSWDEQQLVDMLKVYGEEKAARPIARKIVEVRREEKIETTKQLADLVSEVKKSNRDRLHPATKVFQALRIATNDELENLKKFIAGSIEILESGGRLAIISFHSLEDRIVKNMFRANTGGCVCPKEAPACTCGAKTKIKIVTKKPVTASEEELRRNRRSRSAKMRVAEKI